MTQHLFGDFSGFLGIRWVEIQMPNSDESRLIRLGLPLPLEPSRPVERSRLQGGQGYHRHSVVGLVSVAERGEHDEPRRHASSRGVDSIAHGAK